MTINSYFDNVYLINLERRKDRLEWVSNELKKYGITFQRFNAIDGLYFEDYVKYDEETAEKMRWTGGAAALVETTQLILLDAIEKKYDKILILEDDIIFNPSINSIFEQTYTTIPSDWETLYFGALHRKPYEPINNFLAKVEKCYCCHCYAIHSSIFKLMLELIRKKEKPIDEYTSADIQPRGRSYCFMPNLVYQKTDYSDIGYKCAAHSALWTNLVYE